MDKDTDPKSALIYSHDSGHYYELQNDVFVIGSDSSIANLVIKDESFSQQQIRIVRRFNSTKQKSQFFVENMAVSKTNLIVNSKHIPLNFYFEIMYNSVIKFDKYFFILCEKRQSISSIESTIEMIKSKAVIPYDQHVISKAVFMKKQLIVDKAKLSDINSLLMSASSLSIDEKLHQLNNQILQLDLRLTEIKRERDEYLLSLKQLKCKDYQRLVNRKKEIIARVQHCEVQIGVLLSQAYNSQMDQIEFNVN